MARQRRPDQRSKQVLSPRRKPAQQIMQSQVEVHESVQEKIEETACQKEGSVENIIKNGPENCSSHEEDPKEVIVVKVRSSLYRDLICHMFFA